MSGTLLRGPPNNWQKAVDRRPCRIAPCTTGALATDILAGNLRLTSFNSQTESTVKRGILELRHEVEKGDRPSSGFTCAFTVKQESAIKRGNLEIKQEDKKGDERPIYA